MTFVVYICIYIKTSFPIFFNFCNILILGLRFIARPEMENVKSIKQAMFLM